MGINYENLDEKTRKFMLEEVAMDISNGNIYISKRLNATGIANWNTLLRNAVEKHDDNWLSNQIDISNYLNSTEEKKTRSGKITVAKVPSDAADMLAEGEFNRFYARGLCLRAINENIQELEVYRGKNVRQPRTESQLMIGKKIVASALLEDLRKSIGVGPALGLPPGPNSGLTVRLPKT